MFKPCSIIFVLVASVKTRRSTACLSAATCGEKTNCGLASSRSVGSPAARLLHHPFIFLSTSFSSSLLTLANTGSGWPLQKVCPLGSISINVKYGGKEAANLVCVDLQDHSIVLFYLSLSYASVECIFSRLCVLFARSHKCI